MQINIGDELVCKKKYLYFNVGDIVYVNEIGEWSEGNMYSISKTKHLTSKFSTAIYDYLVDEYFDAKPIIRNLKLKQIKKRK